MTFLEGLRERAAARPRTIAFAEASEPRTAEAMVMLHRDGLVIPLGVGPEEDVREAIDRAGGDGSRALVQDPSHPDLIEKLAPVLVSRRKERGMTLEGARESVRDPLLAAGLLVATGGADGAIAGALAPTAAVIRAGLWCLGPDAGIKTVSSAFYMVVPSFRSEREEVLTFTDAGVVQYPTSVQLAEIAVGAARARRLVVGDEPCVAFLSHSTKGSAEGPSIVLVRDALERFRELAPTVLADGELQGDAALIPDVAERKAPRSTVAGRANVLVFPDLDSANIAYKLVQRLSGAEALGPVIQGLRRPYNDLSRGADSKEIAHVACITSLMAEV